MGRGVYGTWKDRGEGDRKIEKGDLRENSKDGVLLGRRAWKGFRAARL